MDLMAHKFSGNFDLKEGYKQPFRVQMGGFRKFESLVGNLGDFAPPPPENMNFRHCLSFPL
jgi:hypothetical protein